MLYIDTVFLDSPLSTYTTHCPTPYAKAWAHEPWTCMHASSAARTSVVVMVNPAVEYTPATMVAGGRELSTRSWMHACTYQ
jgi:hypothetical protein